MSIRQLMKSVWIVGLSEERLESWGWRGRKGIKLLYLQEHIRFGMSSSILFPTNEYATSNKVAPLLTQSPEEIQKLMMPEQPELETLIHILNKAHPLQLPYVFAL